MIFKVILIVAVASTSCYCKKNQVVKTDNSEKYPEKFVNLYENSDSLFAKNITLYGIYPYVKQNHNRTAKCYLKHESGYSLTIRLFTVKMSDAARGIRKYYDTSLGQFQQKYADHGKKIQNAWMSIVAVMQKYPLQLKTYIKENNFTLAYEYMDKTRKVVEFHDVMSTFLIKDIKNQMPEQAKVIKKQIAEFYTDVKKQTRVIGKKIENCINKKTAINDKKV